MWNNTVTLSGNLTKDIKSDKKGENDESRVTFIVAVNRWKKDEADFILCTAFGKTADYLAEYGKKGCHITLQGRLNTYTLTKDEQNITGMKIIAESAHVDKYKDE